MELRVAAALNEPQHAPLKARQRANREEVLGAAAEAFIERGYAATSIDDVAELLGCTKGRVYHYFRTKGELFLGVHRQALNMAIEAVGPIANSDGHAVPRLRDMAAAHARLMMEEAGYMRLAVQHAEMSLVLEGRTPEQSLTDILALRQEYEGYFEAVIAEGVRTGEFRDVDPRLMAKAALGALNWVGVWYRPSGQGRGTRAAINDVAPQFAQFVTAGLVVQA